MRGCARIAVVTTIGAAGLLLAGCTPPGGVDGNLVNSWENMPEPVGWVPEAGVCHAEDYQESVSLVEYNPVSCDEPHRTETVYVGELTGETAERTTPPAPGSGGWREAYQQCDEAATEYLGADFRTASLWLGVTVPTPTAWEGGARWLRCDVTDLDGTPRSTNLAGALAGSSDLRLGCFVATLNEEEDWVESMDPVSCSEPHDSEFVGVFHSSDSSYPGQDDDAAWRRIHQGCLSQVATYVDLPDDDDMPFRTGTIAVPMEATDWENGDRGFRCYLWLNDRTVEESLAGAGPRGLPVT